MRNQAGTACFLLNSSMARSFNAYQRKEDYEQVLSSKSRNHTAFSSSVTSETNVLAKCRNLKAVVVASGG